MVRAKNSINRIKKTIQKGQKKTIKKEEGLEKTTNKDMKKSIKQGEKRNKTQSQKICQKCDIKKEKKTDKHQSVENITIKPA